MPTSTYSFSDYAIIFDHPSFGQYIMDGNADKNANIRSEIYYTDAGVFQKSPSAGDSLGGLGSITISMANDQTVHEIGVDGKTLVRKIVTTNGNLIIAAQQTSYLHVWLTKLWNYLITADASEWAKLNVQINAAPRVGLDGISASQVSFQKLADRPFQAQGQHVTWTLMFGEIRRFNM